MRSEFAGHERSDVAEHRRSLYAERLHSCNGNVDKFKVVITGALNKYMHALQLSRRSTTFVNGELCEHLLDHFDFHDTEMYSGTVSVLRARDNLTLTTLFSVLSKQYKAKMRGKALTLPNLPTFSR